MRLWFCYELATDPEYQGLGCVTELVQHVYEIATEAGGFISLATAVPLNLKKYLSPRMGFHERGSFTNGSPIAILTSHVLVRGIK
ncbi:hypothetical protein D9758_004524 [Tetrapyrgos nigripes]|uniref:N-acetyltransferase domain-containing protein n=1 Tax=Tetrapyrgos nigripes TaxID=182062 RepID=A0A8H5H0B1_9AGAR|nr:hypothetical protein D9758_004524 [Tetrapyrgos nigripes]